jgi:hypothetical protein
MATKLKVKVPAIREKGTKKVIGAPSPAYSHEELELKEKRGKKEDKRGFLLSNGEFAKRKEAAKVAEKAGQIPKKAGIKKLHSHDLRKYERIKKIKESDI